MQARLTGYVRLIHPFPSLVVTVTSGFLLGIAVGGVPRLSLLVNVIGVVLLSQIAVGALNDFVDRYDDAHGQPDKPIPSGLVQPGSALKLVLAASGLFVVGAAKLGLISAGVIAIALAAGLSYDLWFKPTPLSFLPYVVAFLSLFTWIWIVADRFSWQLLLLYPPGALLLTCAHLANALPDVELDRSLGQRGLAAVLGPRGTFRVMFALYSFPASFTLVFSISRHNAPSTGLAITGMLLAFAARTVGSSNIYRRGARKLVFRLMAPAIGLVGLAILFAATNVQPPPSS